MGIAASAASRSRLRWSCCSAPRPIVRPSVAAVWSALIWDAKDRKSTRLNSSHGYISYAVFCLKKKKKAEVQQLVSAHRHVWPSVRAGRAKTYPVEVRPYCPLLRLRKAHRAATIDPRDFVDAFV